MKLSIVLREIKKEDCKLIPIAFAAQGWNKPEAQFRKYLKLQKEGLRDIIIATIDNEFAAYLTINWESDYPPFRKKGIPEVVDFNVLKKFQRCGIGTALMDEAEARIKKVSKYAGIGFGVTKDYGAAQILYIKRRYIPDGKGLIKDGKALQYGDRGLIDDGVVFYLVKEV